jgi:beta-1,4-mannosyltransferase
MLYRKSSSNSLARRRILAWPREVPLDPYYKRLSDGLNDQGWTVDNFTYWRALRHSYGFVHIHQGTFPFRNRRKWVALPRMLIAMLLLAFARAKGARIIWSVHNLWSHEQYHPRLEGHYLAWISRTLDLSIHMSSSGRHAAFDRYPAMVNRPSVIIPLMHFGETFGNPLTVGDGRRRLKLAPDLRVVLMLGQIRRYKNVPELIWAFRQLPDNDLRLFVVGRPHELELVREIRNLASDSRIALSLLAASTEEVRIYMAAASLVVAPYQEILNSGTALLSLTHHRPVLLPNRGAMAELQSTVGSEWIRLYEPPLTPEEIDAALRWAKAPRPNPPNLSSYSPDRVVEAHASAFLKLVEPLPFGATEA